MDFLLLLQALILGIVEGLTEFLPISSTGHLIVTADLMNFWTPDKRVVFEIAIQLGAILAVCWDYRLKLMTVTKGLLAADPGSVRFTTNVLVAFLPAAVIGFMMIGYIKTYLFNPMVVATALILGGILILFAERREHVIKAETIDDLRWQDALKVGFAQCVAMIPGFSFFLAIPTMIGATVYSVYKHRAEFVLADFPVFAVGFVSAFLVAAWVVKALVRYVSNHDFTIFAWYRIVFGGVILLTAFTGMVDWSAAH